MSDTPETPKKTSIWREFLPSNWKQFVAWAVVCVSMFLYSQIKRVVPDAPPPPIPIFEPPPGGWIKPRDSDIEETARVLQMARFADTEACTAPIGEADYLLYRLAIKGYGKPIDVVDQGQIGTCVGAGFAESVFYTMAAQVALNKEKQALPRFSIEAIYGGSRVEVNGGRVPFSGDGSSGAWAAKWIETRGGALTRDVHGSHDLREYSVPRAREWGNRGVPDELEAIAKKHQAKCTLVVNAEEAKKALAQGYAIAVCSDQGFGSYGSGGAVRDSEGFLAPRGTWNHCMFIAGYRSDRAGFLIVNSWGPGWVSGPKGKYDDIPDGSFWAESSVVERMLRQRDSYAIANADGFKRRAIDPGDWIVHNQNRRPRAVLFGGFPHALAP